MPLLQRSLKRSATGDSIVRKLYALIAVCQRRLHQTREALAVCQEGLWHYPQDVELLFQEAMARRDLGDLAGAEAAYQRCLHGRQGNHFASIDTGLCGYKARHNLAVMYRDQGRLAEAEAQWRRAVSEQVGFAPSWSCLAELYLFQRRWPELEQAAGHLENGAHCPVEGACWRARGHLARHEFSQARWLLEGTVARAPYAVGPRRFLTHSLLQEGRDWSAAEHALRELVTLDPGDAEARHNLAVLLRQQGQPQQPPEYRVAVVV